MIWYKNNSNSKFQFSLCYILRHDAYVGGVTYGGAWLQSMLIDLELQILPLYTKYQEYRNPQPCPNGLSLLALGQGITT